MRKLNLNNIEKSVYNFFPKNLINNVGETINVGEDHKISDQLFGEKKDFDEKNNIFHLHTSFYSSNCR